MSTLTPPASTAAAATPASPAPPARIFPNPPPFPVARFTVDQYHRMIKAGVLGEDDPVELLDGFIALKMPRNPPHDVTIDLAAEAIRARLPGAWRVRVQSAVTMRDGEPEPDLAIVAGPARRYVARHPVPADVALLIEVAESSLDHDRDVKGPGYADAGVPIYWVINLPDAQVEVYSRPTGAAYQQRDVYVKTMAVPLVVAGQTIATIPVPELLP